MSTELSRSASPAAANAILADPSARMIQPTDLGLTDAAAVRDTIPVAPSQVPSLRPAISRCRSVSSTKPPAATVIEPLPRSSRPRASSTSDASETPPSTSSDRRAPARTSTRPLPSAATSRTTSSPSSTITLPVNVAAAVSTSVPAPRFVMPIVPLRTVESITVWPAGTTIPVSRVQVEVVAWLSWLPAPSAIPADAPASVSR